MRECLSEYTPSPAKETFISLDDKQFAVVPVKGLGQIWGYLCLQAEESILKDFLFSIMDRAALAIAQIMLRNRTVEERKQNIEDKMVRNLLHGKACDTDELQAIIPLSANSSHYRLVLIQTNQPEINAMEGDWNEIKLQRSVIFRTLFKQHGLYPAVSVRKNDIAVIASFKLKGSETQGRNQFTQVMRSIKKITCQEYLRWQQMCFWNQ
ncbi:hypothetical protein RWE15_17415 [Virgibacillus halophilus]|uniref:GAF domain-containing protein n=1 Tax=Tigheibacillus halophilus TaxID=361280 RepID=A0ABU5C923_9BACI|nr:hypothetical protein [Virgibacillus halophilus]